MTGRADRAVELAEQQKIPVTRVSPSQLESMSGSGAHQGIGVKVGPYPLADLHDIIDRVESAGRDGFLLLLDNIEDPNNLGALIRTALCAGVDGVVVPKDRAASPVPSVSKASAGALEHVLLAKVTNMAETIKILKESGFWIAGTDNTAGENVYSCDLARSLAIVIGSEEKGIRPLVKKNCDFLVSIPQHGPVDSLNASAAGAVVIYEAYRQKYRNEG